MRLNDEFFNICVQFKHGNTVARVPVTRAKVLIGALVLLSLSLPICVVNWPPSASANPANASPYNDSLSNLIAKQKEEIAKIRNVSQDNLDALAIRLGQLQAQMMRINGLGQHLTEMANLDDGEFDFESDPGLGGPTDATEVQSVSAQYFLRGLDQLEAKLKDQEQQLTSLESLVREANFEKRVAPAGSPVVDGWVSSYYGMRTDPFTGKRTSHLGIDFAGKTDSNVVSVADGVVTWSGVKEGYGDLVEINHGNGYITRYGHNAKNLVEVGDVVIQGQTIAKIGSTGRSTGTHVHFELIKNGRQINPKGYVQKSRDQG